MSVICTVECGETEGVTLSKIREARVVASRQELPLGLDSGSLRLRVPFTEKYTSRLRLYTYFSLWADSLASSYISNYRESILNFAFSLTISYSEILEFGSLCTRSWAKLCDIGRAFQ